MAPPRLARLLLRIISSRRHDVYLGDLEEIFNGRAERTGLARAGRWYWREAFLSLPLFVLESIRWRFVMFKNYLVTAARVFRRDTGFSLLNTAGLALGMACFILIALWVQDEVGWDRFHPQARSIYRVQSTEPADGADLPGPLGPFLKANYPEISDSVRFYYYYTPAVRRDDRNFEEDRFVFADASVLDVFPLRFVAGNASTAFAEPDSVLLTESAAEKYFGGQNPLGQVLNVNQRFDVRVSGVVKDPPANSDIQFRILAEYKSLGHIRSDHETHWGRINYVTYIRLQPEADASAVAAKIAGVVAENRPGSRLVLTLKPLVRVHLYEDGAIRYVAVYILIAVFILAIAACNFINLTTARSGRRVREIAIRKVVGAVRSQLVRQYLFEAMFLSLAALVVALALVLLSLPVFNATMGKHLEPSLLLGRGLLVFLFGSAAAVGLLAGLYPALLLSSFRPARLLRGGHPKLGRSGGGGLIRKILVTTQFAISVFLMISALVVHRQVEFIRNFDVGMEKENVIYLPAKRPLVANHDAFLQELTRRPGIVNAAFASSLPSNATQVVSSMSWEGKDPSDDETWQFICIDERYLDTLGIKLAEGRPFTEFKPVNDLPYFIVNERAAREMGLARPVGSRFSLGDLKGTLIGIVKDFHYMPLRQDIRPLLLFIGPGEFDTILVKFRPERGGFDGILAGIRDLWDKYAPGLPFSYEFLDAAYDLNYRSERRMNAEFKYFTFLGLFISCLGLVGLVAYVADRKRKEIGIRRVLGASLPRVVGRIQREFLGPVVISNAIAWPVAFWIMKSWLRGFVVHAGISPAVFAGSALATLALAAATVGFQSIKAARESPARSLRNE